MENWPEFIKQHFNALPYFQFMQTSVLETEEGYAKLTLPLKAEYANTYGIAHGAILTGFIDMCAGVALRTLKLRVLTLQVSTDYFRSALLTDVLYGEARIVRRGGKVIHTAVTVSNQDGVAIGQGSGIYYISGEDSAANYDTETKQFIAGK